MESKDEAHSDDGSYEMVNEDDYASDPEHVNSQGGVANTMGLSDDSSYEVLCSEVSETLVLTEDEGLFNFTGSEYSPADEETRSVSSESAKSDMELKTVADSDPTEGDGCGRVVSKGKKRDLMTMLYGMPNLDQFDFPVQIKLKDDIKEVAKNHIIRYLPAKSLFKCRQVSKEWNNWISCPFFAHTQSQYFRKTSGFFECSNSTPVGFISLEKSAYGVPYPSLVFLPKPVSIKSSSNGLLLCQAFDDEDEFYVCNPANQEWTRLPCPTSYHGVEPKFVLVFEPSSLNFEPIYQVVCLFSPYHDAVPIVCFDIYDSETKLWRESSMICPDFDASDITSDSICVNGVAYWETKGGGLLAFDLKNEIYSVQQLPFDEGGALTNIHGEICYVRAQYDHAMKSCRLDVYGDGIISLKNTIIVPVGGVEEGEFVDCRVLANPCDDVVALAVEVSQWQNSLYVYHVKDEKVQGPVFFNRSVKLIPYVNSLVSVGA